MECLQSRIDSFSGPVKVQNSANTGPVKKLKWPHPPSFTANPLSLAEAGFYFDPSYDERDNVTCFVCGKELAGWDDHDDPFDIHWKKCAKACPWAVVRCALKADLDSSGRFSFSNKNRLPSSKLLEKARLQVFAVGDGWIHDQVRNHGASSKRMAKAGFLFTPQHPDDDSATCLYCNLSLNEWDSADDPLDEHRKRKGTVCPFFIGSVTSSNAPATSSSTRSIRSSSSTKYSSHISTTATKTRGRGRSIMPDIVQDTIEPLAPPADAGPSRKQGNKASRSRQRKTIHEEPEDGDEQADEEHQQSKKKSRASTRSLSRSVSRKKDSSSKKKKTVPTVSEEEQPHDVAPTGSTITRSRSRKPTKSTVAQQSDTDEHETKHNALTKSNKSSSRPGSKSKAVLSPSLEDYATAPEEVPEDDGHREEEDISVALAHEKSSSHLITESETWKDTPVTEANEVEEDQVPVTSKTRKTSISSERSTTTVREKKTTTTEITSGGGDNEQETLTLTNSEDEIEADLEDVQLDDTEMNDHITEEAPQELDAIDEEAVSFAPRLVTKAFSEVEQEQQQQRPRTPNLVPFMEMARSVLSSSGRIDLGTNAAGPEEETYEVEVEKIPKTPPRKFVVDGDDPVPLVSSADMNDNLTVNAGVDVDKVEHSVPQSKSEQVEEKSFDFHFHHHRTSQQEQEQLKTQEVEPQFVPFLSRLPFVPLHVLTEAELDMTVEDWIRYQMEVEYDKFKRDGERELMRFRKKAEETRRIIEGL